MSPDDQSSDLKKGTRVRSLIRLTGDHGDSLEIGALGTVLKSQPFDLLAAISGLDTNGWSYVVHFDDDWRTDDVEDGLYMRQHEIEPVD